MSPQLTGILLGVFSAIVGAIIIWGAFFEQNRANSEYKAKGR
jgi:hypothetical protein